MCLNPVLTSWGTSKCVVLGMIFILVGAHGPEPVMQFTCIVTEIILIIIIIIIIITIKIIINNYNTNNKKPVVDL